MPSERDWKKIAADIRRYVNLAASPVAVKLLPNVTSLAELKGVRQLQNTAPCQMAAWARYYGPEGVVGASAQGVKCVWGSSCTGLMKAPERLNEGDLAWRYAKDGEAGKRIQDSMGVLGLGGKRFDALVMAPLGLTPVDPDVIVMYVTPAQALRVIIAYTFWSGEEIRSVITGQSSLCSSIAHAYDEKNLFVDIPCIGDRMFGLVQEQEMIVAFHESRTEQIVDGLRETEDFSGHPFKPFLRWPVVFAPDMEPRRTELE
ncbi:MAG TPA: DUF169 domain-containing protein [Methanomassiliicoccales archaeon]|nr:DUF169 domain-containing protein [Methanomassiliicoccales archaeon]